MTIEIWKDIPGFEGRYQASDQGRVRSLDRTLVGRSKAGRPFTYPMRGRVLRPGLCRGYLIVNLSPKGTIAVHLLVARTFLPPPTFDGAEANHIDGVKANCAASNLEWLTHAGNQQHAVVLGLRQQAVAVVAPSGVRYPSIAQAARGERVRASTARAWSQA